MGNRYYILFVGLILLSFMSKGQTNGKSGNDTTHSINGLNIVSFDALGFYSLGGNEYKEQNGELIEKNQRAIYGMRISYIHFTSPSFAIGAEYSMDKSSFYVYRNNYKIAPQDLSSDTTYFARQYEDFEMISHSFAPKIEWNSNPENPLSGFSQQIGIGFQLIKIVNKNYFYEDTPYTVNEYESDMGAQFLSSIDNKPLYDESKMYFGISLFYAVNFRIKLAEKIALNLGLRHAINNTLYTADNQFVEETIPFQYGQVEIGEDIRDQRLINTTMLNLGLSYSF